MIRPKCYAIKFITEIKIQIEAKFNRGLQYSTDWYQVSFTSQQITTEMMIRYKFIYLVGKVIVSDFTVYSQEYNG